MSSGLSEEMMRLQIGVYGLAARQELEYDPNHGLVRYIGEDDPDKQEMVVDMTDREIAATRAMIVNSTRAIKARTFEAGPSAAYAERCRTCDFHGICGRPEARIPAAPRRNDD